MKIKFLILSAVSLFLISCGSDDCTQADWIGTYSGTDMCETTTDGVTENTSDSYTVVITAGATEDEILVDGDPFTIDGCKVSFSEGDISFSMELDGNTITGESSASFEFLGTTISSTCTFTGSK